MSARINHIPSLSVGIPAYNEAANIGRLLREIVAQEESGFSLLEILVLSDGSTDGTKAEVEAVTDPRIKFTDSRQRLGKSGRVNQILQRGRGDIILLLDADITLRNSRFISEAVAGFDPEVHGLSGFNTTPVPGRTFVERSLNSSIRIVETVRRHWNNGLNFLGYRGSGIMLAKTLARSLKLPQNLVTDDAFYFFSALAAGYTPRYRPDLRIYYRSPSTIRDHLKQSQRFKYLAVELHDLIQSPRAQACYHLPTSILLRATVEELLRHPLETISYIAINAYTKISAHRRPDTAWNVVSSTKKLD